MAFRVNVTDVENTDSSPDVEKVASSPQKVASTTQEHATLKKNKSAEEMAIYMQPLKLNENDVMMAPPSCY